ncbi:MAG: DUF6273 domain-containing protein [Acholeplasmatales bacterium]|nr:DUF6273 domain-containing protein [Acholeplasmatales bacterium]
MRKFKFLSLFLFTFLFSILIVSCSSNKKSDDNNTTTDSSSGTSQIIEDNNTTTDSSSGTSQIIEDKYYNVDFKNYDGDLLLSTKVKEGATPKFTGDEPTKPDTETSYYTFKGWNPELSAINSDMTYIAQFERHDCVNYTITFKNYDDSILQSGFVSEGSRPSYNGTPFKPNDEKYYYTFSGWDTEIVPASQNATYWAEFEAHELPYTISVDLDGGSSVTLNKQTFKTDKLTSDMLVFDVNKSGFAFRGYTLNDVLIFDEYGNLEVSNIQLNENEVNVLKAKYDTNVKLTIKYTLYNPLTNELVEESISKPYYADDVSETATYECNTLVNLFAEAADDYMFTGWYSNGIVLSNYTEYNYMMWEKDLTLEARFAINPYRLTIQTNKEILGTVDIVSNGVVSYQANDYQMYLAGTQVTISAYTKGETTFLGWYEIIDDEELFVSPNAIYSFVMPKKDYTLEARWELTMLTTKSNNESFGTLTSNSVYTKEEIEAGTEISLSCNAKTGYIFDGWYEGNKLVSENLTFTYEMPKRAVTLVARFKGISVELINSANVTTDFVSGITHKTNETITIKATNNTGKKLIWYYNNSASNYGDSYTFKTGTTDLTIKVIASDSFESIVYTKENNKIYFGSYPQTKVEATIENGLAGITYDSTWTSYGYSVSSTQSNFMYYKDVDTNNDGIYDFRGVYFTQYRSYMYSLSSTYTYQYDNGYSTKTIYWFSYDPVEWIILEEKDGKALIIANLILDSQEYNPSNNTGKYTHNGGTGYANNYELSSIRKWINETFYITTFNGLQEALIDKTTVENAASTTSNSTNPYTCNTTEDKMFLLSYGEAWNYFNSNDARQAKATDYAKCQGAYVLTNGKYAGNAYWLLRSPYSDSSIESSVISQVGSETNQNVAYTCYGVRPACWITL